MENIVFQKVSFMERLAVFLHESLPAAKVDDSTNADVDHEKSFIGLGLFKPITDKVFVMANKKFRIKVSSRNEFVLMVYS